jgi:hypothetical protein
MAEVDREAARLVIAPLADTSAEGRCHRFPPLRSMLDAW